MRSIHSFLICVYTLAILSAPFYGVSQTSEGKHYLSLAANGTSIFAGTDDGIFISTNNGASWAPVNNGLPAKKYINQIYATEHKLYAGTRDDGIFTSENNGEVWKESNTGLDPKTVYSLAGNGTAVFAGNYGGFFLSKNSGELWTKSNQGLKNVYVHALAAKGNIIFAGTEGAGMYRSLDLGQTWTWVNDGLIATKIKCILVKDAAVFAGTLDGGLFITANDGVSWSPVNTGIPTKKIRSLALMGTTLFVGTDAGVFLSNNNGRSWYPVNGGLNNKDVMQLTVSGTNLFAALYDEGIVVLNSTRTLWSPVNNGFDTPVTNSFNAPVTAANPQPVPVKENILPASGAALSYYNRAMAEFAYNNLPSAIQLMNKAIELKPDYADALAYRGYFYNLNKQYDKAISDYLAADKVKKNVVGYPMACPFALTGKKDEAFKYLESCLSAPEDKPSLSSIIDDKELNNLHDDPRWKTMISKEWCSPYEKLIQEGNKKIAEKDVPGGMDCWNKAIALDPNKDAAYGARALTYINSGNFEKALADLNIAIRLKPTNSTYYGNRAYVYKELKRKTEAMADYNKAVALDPQNMVYADRAMMKFSIDQKDPGVEADLKTYLECFYKDDFNYFLLGTYYYNLGSDNNAISALTKAIELNNAQSDYFIKRGNAYFGTKQYSDAIEDFTKAITLDPKSGAAYYGRGTVKGQQLNKIGACEDWRKAQSLGYEDSNGYVKSICD